MIGFIITGHGSYAPGMNGAMEMIAGAQDKIEIVPFLEEMDLEVFKENLANAIHALRKENLEVVIFTDLLGGTPFKTAATFAFEQKSLEIVAGTNLPMLIEGSMLRFSLTSAKELVNQLIQTGQTGIQALVLDSLENEINEEEFAEGI